MAKPRIRLTITTRSKEEILAGAIAEIENKSFHQVEIDNTDVATFNEGILFKRDWHTSNYCFLEEYKEAEFFTIALFTCDKEACAFEEVEDIYFTSRAQFMFDYNIQGLLNLKTILSCL